MSETFEFSLLEMFRTQDIETIKQRLGSLSKREATQLLDLLEALNRQHEQELADEVNIHDITDALYDLLYWGKQTIDFETLFPYPEANREFGYIKLNDDYVIKVERL